MEKLSNGVSANEAAANLNPDNQANLNNGAGESGTNQNDTNNAADDFDATQWQLNVKGSIITPRDREHLRSLAQMGMSYSQSMEALKQEKAALAEQNERLKPYMELDNRFQTDADFQQYLSSAIEAYQAKKQLGSPETLPPYVQELFKKVQEFDGYKSQMEMKNADEALAREIESLKASYPNEKWDVDNGEGTLTRKILQHAYENNIPSLATAYKDLMFEQIATNTRAEALKEAERKKAEALKAGKVAGSSVGAPVNNSSPTKYDPNDSYNDLVNKALASLLKK